MITCGKCQRQNEDHYKFCLGCGTPLAQAAPPEPAAPAEPVAAEPVAAPAPASTGFVTCPSCVARVEAGHRFCRKCGSPIPSDAAPAPAPESDAPVAAAAAAAPVAAAPVAAAEPAVEPAVESAPVASAPAPAAETRTQVGQLIMVNPDGTPGDSVPLFEGENVLGKESAYPVLQRDEYLSPQHASFVVQGDSVQIRDLDSINGVYYRINQPTEISPNDYVRLGQEVLLFQSTQGFPEDQTLDAESGSPIGAIWGRIARISAPGDQASNAYVLWKNEHTIGRERGDFTIPDDGFVSGLHARIYRDDRGVFIEDLQSSNGTYLRIKGSHTVSNNALLLIGKQPFRIKIGA